MSGFAGGDLEGAPDERRAILLLAAFALAWVVLEVVVGGQVRGHYNLMQIVWTRYAVHLLALVLLFGRRNPGRLWRTGRPVYQLSRSLLMFVMPFSFATALGLGVPADTIWSVFWVAPVLIVAGALLLLHEPVPPRAWIGAALGAAVAMLMHPPHDASPLLLLLPMAMSLSFSLYVVMTRELRHEPVLANLFYTALGVLLVLTPMMPFVWVTPSPHDALAMTGIGLLGLVALFALDRATAAAPVAATAPVLYLYLAGLFAAGTLLHGDAPSRRGIAGTVAIVGMVALLWFHAPRGAGARPVLRENPAR